MSPLPCLWLCMALPHRSTGVSWVSFIEKILTGSEPVLSEVKAHKWWVQDSLVCGFDFQACLYLMIP